MMLGKGIAACVLAAATLLAAPASAKYNESHVWTNNDTTDAYVWVTAYRTDIAIPQAGAWCVPPGKHDQHGLHATLNHVRIEVSHGGCQHTPVLRNEYRDFSTDLLVQVYRVTPKHDGSYDVWGPLNP
jgi:hypothetical protein